MPIRFDGGPGPGRSTGPALAVAPVGNGPIGPSAPADSGQTGTGTPRANDDPTGRTSTGTDKVADWGPYMAELQRRIKHNWFPPKAPSSMRVVVVFKIHRNGDLSHLILQKSCGDAVSDQAAMKAVQNAAPFRHLPDGAEEDADIEFSFDYNLFSGHGGAIRQF